MLAIAIGPTGQHIGKRRYANPVRRGGPKSFKISENPKLLLARPRQFHELGELARHRAIAFKLYLFTRLAAQGINARWPGKGSHMKQIMRLVAPTISNLAEPKQVAAIRRGAKA